MYQSFLVKLKAEVISLEFSGSKKPLEEMRVVELMNLAEAHAKIWLGLKLLRDSFIASAGQRSPGVVGAQIAQGAVLSTHRKTNKL